MVHVVAAALGLSAVLARSAHAFGAVKAAGAAYLIYLGLQRLTVGRQGDERGGPADDRWADLRRIYVQGVVVNVLNPKTALFFLAFLPQFVDPTGSPAGFQMVVLGLWFIGLGSPATRRNRLSGAAYIGLGLTAAAAGHPVRRATP